MLIMGIMFNHSRNCIKCFMTSNHKEYLLVMLCEIQLNDEAMS